MHTHKDTDGGWEVEPSSKKVGKEESRVISTCYALRGLFDLGHTVDTSRDVRDAVNYLVDIVNPDGGWGGREGTKRREISGKQHAGLGTALLVLR